ncbi:MRGRH protein, partial [Bucorvus abyssinicus]|nr:MRGRH protein [Bucorvus abyssinicus]NWR59907.1 MRGRH protein [Bucorvus abyssinicus]NWR59908.1 MRGRH protein [Bucorvus abyssinicus]
ETITTDLPLNYMTSGYVDHEEKTDYDCSGESHGLVVFSGVSLGIALCGLVGNGRVMWFLVFNVKRNPFTVYILNLAVADFSLLLLFSLILLVVLSLVAFCSPNFLLFSEDFAFVVVFLCHFFDLSSLALLTTISVERCTSVL